ncbi:MAG TPA: DUF192 domain-containing protein [bacterium]|nr:DUF192 domain-containing protein [bacterium]
MPFSSPATAGRWILLLCLCGTISAAENFCGYTPKATVAILSEGKKSYSFLAAVADRPELHRRGLMGCAALPPKQGLLFIFDDLRERFFWMHDTMIPLAILYIGDDGRIVSIKEGKPGSDATIPSGHPVRYALEVNLKEGLAVPVGATVKISFD